tara:strand:- start:1656 stop:3266 length:1611 start_codon:yes stop_codon:yes gene_type:complete
MLVKKDKISIRISFSKDDLNSSSVEKIIYEDSQYLVSISRLKNFLSSFKEIKPFEILSEKENGKYSLILPTNLESSETKISIGSNSELISKLRNHSSKLAAPFFLKSFHRKNLVLKNYQLEGVNWLVDKNGRLLADDMGLGKTLQALYAAISLMLSGKIGCVLIISPTSLIRNWANEIEKWFPKFTRTIISKSGSKKDAVWENAFNYSHFVITNYEQLRDLPEILENNTISLIIADEAHKLRKGNSKIFKTINNLNKKRFWALTGTPIEKNQEDVAHILKLVDQNLNLETLRKYDDISLSSTVEKYMLRRMKEEVLNELKDYEEVTHFIDLSEEQKKSYDLALRKGIINNDSKDRLSLFSELRTICDLDIKSETSSKVDFIIDRLENIKLRGEKAVVFSFWINPLRILKKALDESFTKQSSVLYIGDFEAEEREESLNKFKKSENCFVFLCSAKIGGEGLNLTNANHVFFFNKWWNPSNNKQAKDRIIRIGQERKSYIHSVISKDTVESRIEEIINKKNKITDEIIEGIIEEVIEK